MTIFGLIVFLALLAILATFWHFSQLFVYHCTSLLINKNNLPETRKIWECFVGETQQVQRRCIAKLRADVEVENRWLCTYKKKRYEGLEN